MHTFNVLQRNWKSTFNRGIEFAYKIIHICCVCHIVCYGSVILLLHPLCYFLCSIYFKLIISHYLFPQYKSFCNIAHVFHWSYLRGPISLVLCHCYYMYFSILFNSDFFLPIVTGSGTHSIGKNGIKIKRIGIFYQCTCNVKLISKEEKVRTRQDALISLW